MSPAICVLREILFVFSFKSQDPKSLLFDVKGGEADRVFRAKSFFLNELSFISRIRVPEAFPTKFLCKIFQIENHKYTLI